MILLWLVALSSLVVGGEASCSNAPCTQSDYRSYSRCIQNQCAGAVVASPCSPGTCASVNCNTCSSSSSSACCKSCCSSASSCECSNVNCNTCTNTNACCNTCCASQCECPKMDCGTCQGYTPCCQSCCQKDCCQSSTKGECCKENTESKCCDRPVVIQAPAVAAPAPQPPIIVMPNITLPNITIFVNQNPVLSYNVSGISLNQTCGGVSSQTNGSHITYIMRENCSSPCCATPYSPGCYPTPIPPYAQCPTVGYNYGCGPQCLLQPPQMYQPSMIPPPPQMVYQPQFYQPPPPPPMIIRQPPQIIQSPPQIIQAPPQIIQAQPQIIQAPPQFIQAPPMYQQQPQCVVNMPYQQCPQQCPSCVYQPYQMGGYQSGCIPSPTWPYMRCPSPVMPLYGGFQGLPGFTAMQQPVQQQQQPMPVGATLARG